MMKLLVARVNCTVCDFCCEHVNEISGQVGARTKRDADGFDRPDILHEALIRHARQ